MKQLENIKMYWNKRAEGYAKSIADELLEQKILGEIDLKNWSVGKSLDAHWTLDVDRECLQ